MLKSLFLLISVSFFLLPSEVRAAVLCDGFTPEIEVIPSLGHIEKDRSLRAVDLNSQDAWGDLMVDHIDGQSTLKAENQYKIQKAKKGDEVCLIISHVKILYKLDAVLKIVDDYPKDSCEYEQVAAHAARHVAVAKDFLAQTAPLLQDYVTKALAGGAGIATHENRVKKMEPTLQQRVDSILQEYVRYLNREHRQAQRRIVDLPEERAKILAACPDWKAPQDYIKVR